MAVELAVATLEERTVVELEVETHLVNGDLLLHVGAVWTSGQTSYSSQLTTTQLVLKHLTLGVRLSREKYLEKNEVLGWPS